MKKKYSRILSFSERLWIIADQINTPFVNQFILEGEGKLDYNKWQRAIEIASEANPGSRLVLKGHLGFARWVDSGETPRLREMDGSNWDGYGPAGAPFLLDQLHPRKGPTCEAILLHGNPLRVVFKTFHGVMDGRGTVTWVEDIIRVLNGLPPIGSSATMNDRQIARTFQTETRKKFPIEHLSPTPDYTSGLSGLTWRRVRLKGSYSNILAQCALFLAKAARKNKTGVVRFAVPVDMRPRVEGLRSTANQSNAIIVEVLPDSTSEDIKNDIKKQLEEKRDGVLIESTFGTDFIPLCVMKYAARKIINYQYKTGLYNVSGVISNMGKIPFDAFSGGGFKATGGFMIAPGTELIPIFMVIVGGTDYIDLIFSVPRVLAGHKEKNLNDLIDFIKQGLRA